MHVLAIFIISFLTLGFCSLCYSTETENCVKKALLFPRSENLEVVSAKQAPLGGMIYRAKRKGDIELKEDIDLNRFLFEEGLPGGQIRHFIRHHGRSARKLGFVEHRNGDLEYPDATAINRILDTNGESFFRFFPSFTGHVSDTRYLSRLAEGEIAYSTSGEHHFHDLFVHLIFIFMPKELSSNLQAQAKFLMELRYKVQHDSVLANQPELIKGIEETIAERVREIDVNSALLFSEFLKFKNWNKELVNASFYSINTLAIAASSIEKKVMKRLDPTKLPDEQKQRLKKTFSELNQKYKDFALPESQYPTVLKDMFLKMENF